MNQTEPYPNLTSQFRKGTQAIHREQIHRVSQPRWGKPTTAKIVANEQLTSGVGWCRESSRVHSTGLPTVTALLRNGRVVYSRVLESGYTERRKEKEETRELRVCDSSSYTDRRIGIEGDFEARASRFRGGLEVVLLIKGIEGLPLRVPGVALREIPRLGLRTAKLFLRRPEVLALRVCELGDSRLGVGTDLRRPEVLALKVCSFSRRFLRSEFCLLGQSRDWR
ncbi:unnamed protein product [Calypogeia fissa]